jgi:hypothetical protein
LDVPALAKHDFRACLRYPKVTRHGAEGQHGERRVQNLKIDIMLEGANGSAQSTWTDKVHQAATAKNRIM